MGQWMGRADLLSRSETIAEKKTVNGIVIAACSTIFATLHNALQLQPRILLSLPHSLSLSLSRTMCVCETVLVCVSRSVIKRFFALIHDLCIQCSLRCRIRHSRRHREQTRCPLAQKSRKRVRVAPAAVCVDVSRRHWQQQLRLPQPPRRGAGNVEQPAAGDPFLLSGGRAYFQCVPSVCAVCACVCVAPSVFGN